MGSDELRPFGDLLAVPLRNGLTRPKAVRGAGTKMVNMGELFAHPRIEDAPMDRVPLDGVEREKSCLLAGDLLFARQSLVLEGAGKCSVFVSDAEPVTFESHIIRARLNRDVADPDFYFYYFMSPNGRASIRSIVEQVAAAGIRERDLERLPVPVPPAATQHEVAKTLRMLDDKIELNRRANHTLESIARAIFKSWFVDFDPVRKKMKCGEVGLPPDLAAQFPCSLSPSILGAIPKGWGVATVGDVSTELETGSRPQGGVAEIASGVPSVGAESIVRLGRFDFSKTKFVSRGFFESMSRGHVKNRDVLIYKDGGRPGMFEPHVSMFGGGFPFEEFCVNEHVYRLRVSEQLSQSYMYLWLSTELATGEMRERGTGVAIPGLNSTALRAVPVLLPEARLVRRFTDWVEPAVARILGNASEVRLLEQTRDALLPELLGGRASVC